MILEIVTSLAMGGLVAKLKFSGGSDAQKIEKICTNCGLTKEKKSIQIYRRSNIEGGTEYAFRIPYGLSFSDFVNKLDQIQDGLNAKKTVMDIRWEDIKNINLRENIPKQVKTIIDKKMQLKKEVELAFDGMLKVRVYNQPLTDDFPYDESLLAKCKGWKIPIGTTRQDLILHDFDKIPHMIVAGTTTYGKTVFLKNLITTFIHTQPKHVKFTLIDLKGGLAFNRFKNCSQVLTVAKDEKETLEALKKVKKELYEKLEYMYNKGFENIKESGTKERHFIIVDEAAIISPNIEKIPELKQTKSECELILSEIARIGGSIGYRLIYATQAPYREVLNPQIKQNCDAKVCFMLQTESASRVVLDESGAEKLPLIKGRAIYQTDKRVIVQTPFIKNDFIEKVITPHIVLKPRKDDQQHENGKRDTNRADSIVFEEA
jgi:S-DNA-T family DNA segregation ATPase FtsK/SpoIIIE